MNRYLNNQYCKFFILLGFLISITYSIFITNKYDQNYLTQDKNKIEHYLIKSDVEDYFNIAFNFNNDLKKKSFFYSGGEYTASYLHPKIISFFFIILDKEIRIKSDSARIDNNGYIFNINNNKFIFLLFQTLLYYSSIFFFYKKTQNKINTKILNIVILFLSIEPTLIQWNSSFMTESVFLSLLLFLISLLINTNVSKIKNLFIGILIGIMYAQRTVAIFLIAPIFLYYLFYFKNIKIVLKNSFFIIIGQAVILIFIGYHNYTRSEIFYITPWQSKIAGYYYAADNIKAKGNNVNSAIISEERLKKEKEWVKGNNIQMNLEKDRLKLYDYQQKYFLKILKNYPLESFKYFAYKSAQTLILDPVYTYSIINMDLTVPKYWKTDDSKKMLIIKIIYSLVIYMVCFYGFLHSFKNLNHSLIILFGSFAVYFLIMLGWVGVTRYSVPILMCLSIFFANGIVSLKVIKP
jgi:hypothetical protein